MLSWIEQCLKALSYGLPAVTQELEFYTLLKHTYSFYLACWTLSKAKEVSDEGAVILISD